jgi:hypothetical protein
MCVYAHLIETFALDLHYSFHHTVLSPIDPNFSVLLFMDCIPFCVIQEVLILPHHGLRSYNCNIFLNYLTESVLCC